MADEEQHASQTARLCELQEQQLTKLTELVDRVTTIADGSQRSNETHDEKMKIWEEDRTRGLETIRYYEDADTASPDSVEALAAGSA